MTLDELESYGMGRMSDQEIRGLLSSTRFGVLGLPTEGAPYLLPLSFGFDGDSALYFLYVLGGDSRKDELTRHSDAASFLVYSAETAFNWRSVMLHGMVSEVPADESEDVFEDVMLAWRPVVFEDAVEQQPTKLYRFDVEEWTGIKHTGLPPGFYGGGDADTTTR
ncbi:pyridoxamine 5'-phosphate oxidase family protein [Haloarculaceae archaeon H-GB2-1]|nr:pyridoxamine 5'-phosphate oxidase family protein [Haloarculaceae archaeon H-GB1-1]MEA5407086.1 pyridoxamine 5'-phosphate oxidase family protein [Haloarculaceae archaeon H-GB2-1]